MGHGLLDGPRFHERAGLPRFEPPDPEQRLRRTAWIAALERAFDIGELSIAIATTLGPLCQSFPFDVEPGVAAEARPHAVMVRLTMPMVHEDADPEERHRADSRR